MVDFTEAVFIEKKTKKLHMIMRMDALRRDIAINANKITYLIKYGAKTKDSKAFINELHCAQAYRKKTLRLIRDNMRKGIYYFVPTAHEHVNIAFPLNQYCDVTYNDKKYTAFNEGRMVIFLPLPRLGNVSRHNAVVFGDAFGDKSFDTLMALVYNNKIEFNL